MKNVLENYLYLLTEDPEMERLDREYKQARTDVFKHGSGPDGADALNAKYANTPKHEIPKHHKKVIDDYREKVDKFSKISDERKKYSEWVRNGKKGPKPSDNFNSDWGSRRNKYNEELKKRMDEILKDIEKQERIQRKIRKTVRIIYWSYLISVLLTTAYNAYKYNYSKAGKECKKLYGKNKEICMLEFKIRSLESQREVLQKGFSQCLKTNDPNRCKQEINKKIIKINKKIINIENKIKHIKIYN